MGDLAKLRDLYEKDQYGRLDEAWALYRTEPMATDPEWHLLGALTAWRMVDRFQAKRVVERGLQLGAEGPVLGKLRFVAGSVLREIGDYPVAVEHLTQLMDEWDQYPVLRPLLEGAALHNLALAFRCQGLLADALEASRRAASVFSAWSADDDYRRAMQNQAWVLCELGDGAGARAVLDQVEELCSEGAARLQQQLGRAYVALVVGDLAGVSAFTGAILDASGVPQEVLAQAAWLRGRGHLAGSNLAEASSWARVSQEWAVQTGEARLMNWATHLLQAVQAGRKAGA